MKYHLRERWPRVSYNRGHGPHMDRIEGKVTWGVMSATGAISGHDKGRRKKEM